MQIYGSEKSSFPHNSSFSGNGKMKSPSSGGRESQDSYREYHPKRESGMKLAFVSGISLRTYSSDSRSRRLTARHCAKSLLAAETVAEFLPEVGQSEIIELIRKTGFFSRTPNSIIERRNS